MKTSKKGLTLVEVLVAIAVLTIVIFAVFSSIIAMRNVVSRQEEYVKAKMVCQDIEVYLEKYNDAWYKEYFGENIEIQNKNDIIGYLTSDFVPTDNENEGVYVLSCEYETTTGKINGLSIFTKAKDRVVIKGVYLTVVGSNENEEQKN